MRLTSGYNTMSREAMPSMRRVRPKISMAAPAPMSARTNPDRPKAAT